MLSLKEQQGLLIPVSYGLYAVTVKKPDGGFNGCIINTVFQVTSDPPVVALSIHRSNYTHELLSASGECAVTVLSEETPASVIQALGYRSGRDADKLARVRCRMAEGLPLCDEAPAGYIVFKVTGKCESLATHTLFFCEPVAGERFADKKPMTYEFFHREIKGKASKFAATFISS